MYQNPDQSAKKYVSRDDIYMAIYRRNARTVPLHHDDKRGNISQFDLAQALNDPSNMSDEMRLMIDTYCRALVHGFNERVAFVATFCDGAEWDKDHIGARLMNTLPRLNRSAYVEQRIEAITAATPVSTFWNPQRALESLAAFEDEMREKGKDGLAKKAHDEAQAIRAGMEHAAAAITH